MDTTDVLTVSEVAARSGFAPSALRYYEAQGLIEASRTAGGQRRYARSVLRRLHDFATKNKIWPTDAHITRDAYGRAARLGEQAEVFIKAPSYEDAIDTRPMDAASPA